MLLKEWMAGPPKWTNEALSKKLNQQKARITPSYLSCIKNARRPPEKAQCGKVLAKKISDIAEGKVSIEEILFPHPFMKK